MGTYQPLIYKIATEPHEFELIYRLNYRTFVEEIPQHSANREKRLIDRFHEENTYIVCMNGAELLGWLPYAASVHSRSISSSTISIPMSQRTANQ